MPTQILHRLKEARERSGLSLRTVSRRTGISMSVLHQQEASNDISLLDLSRWRDALGVPFEELLGEPPEMLSELTRFRAGLLQIMRGVRSLLQTDLSERQQTFVENIETTLQTLMPEVEGIGSWPIYGDARSRGEAARIESQIIDTSVWFPEIHHEA